MTLLELINSEPALAQAVRDGNNGAIQLWLNTPAITVSRKIPITEFVAALYNCGAFVAIKRAAATGNQTAALAVEILRDSKTLGIENVDFTLPVNQDLLNKLVDEDVLSQMHIDAVAALAVAIVSPAEAHGLGAVSIEQIAKALRS